ncbi:hypothetical protein QUF80_02410 [Desulfococcaceae bacterium HSG8]|nr:hypothetical protein [Desulfococcaceae bacterium HSG8]
MRSFLSKKKIDMGALMVTALFGMLLFSSRAAGAGDFGIVTDVSGKVFIQRGEQKIAADLAMNVFVSDKVSIEKDSEITIISYDDCMEWVLKGADQITFRAGKKKPLSEKHEISAARKLPVCYKPDAFQGVVSQKIGGIPLMGVEEDPVACLREEAEKGSASNSALMILIMHDLKQGERESALVYFEALKARLPESGFVKDMAASFAK